MLKALALGAKACFVGRAWAYALGAAGESGVRNMLDILREELKVAMVLTGCNDVGRATPDLLLKDRRLPQHSRHGLLGVMPRMRKPFAPNTRAVSSPVGPPSCNAVPAKLVARPG